MNLGIIGAGCYGSALACILSSNFDNIEVFDINKEVINEINHKRTNKRYMNDLYFPLNIKGTVNMEEFCIEKDYIIFAVPSKNIRQVCKSIKNVLSQNTKLINVSKGFEIETGLMIHEVFEEELPNNKYITMSGPSHAEEIARKMPTFLIAASNNINMSREVSQIFSTEELIIQPTTDIKGVEIGGCVKNIIAIGAGILDGLGYGDNTSVALMLSGLNEIKEIGKRLGCDLNTLDQLSGIGDLIVTCSSKHSRNRQFGNLISKGIKLEDALIEVGSVVEGVSACRSIALRMHNNFEDLIIINSIYKIINNIEKPKVLIKKIIHVNKYIDQCA